MKFTNLQMEQMVEDLCPHLDRTDELGFAVIRNTRLLIDALQEFQKFKNELVVEYGEEVTDADGKPTGKYTVLKTSENWDKVATALKEWENIEVDVPIHTVSWEVMAGNISGADIVRIGWMLEDGAE